MGNKVFHRDLAAEYQPGGLLLQVDRSAVAAENRTLSHANRRARELDTLFIGSLGEQQYTRSRPRAGDGVLDQTGGRSGDDHDVGAAAFGQVADLRDHVFLARIPRFDRATAPRQSEAPLD